MVITFGKHYGKPLSEIPPSYLLWALDNVVDLQPKLRSEIRKRLCLPPLGHREAALTGPVITEAWYRQLAMEFHPDRRRGSHDGMLAINSAHDLLLEMSGGAR